MSLLLLLGKKAGGINSYSLSLALTSSLVPVRGTGTATFTRATTATVPVYGGLLETAKIGEARFEGARRVENLNTASENLLDSSYQVSGVTKNSATQITVAPGYIFKTYTVVPGATYVFSWKAKLGTNAYATYAFYNDTTATFINTGTSYESILNNSTYTRVSVSMTAPV